MRLTLLAPASFLLAACGSSEDSKDLKAAANQSEPVAAGMLENAAESGANAQEALAAAGRAEAGSQTDTAFASGNDGTAAETNGTLQTRPNLPGSPNPPAGGQPPQKVDTSPPETRP